MVGDAVDFLSAFAVGRKVDLEKATTPDALPIIGDRIQLQQVLINLMVNAFEALADARSVDRRISIRTLRVENFAELSISDNGPGIPEDRLKEVFEPFVTSKAEGMGMGLSIARTIRGSARRTDMGQEPQRWRRRVSSVPAACFRSHDRSGIKLTHRSFV